MIVVDSSVWISNLHGFETEATHRLDSVDELDIIVGDLVLLELLQGARSEVAALNIEARMQRFGISPMLNAEIAIAAARNYRHLRRLGVTIPKTPDLIIATFCIAGGHQLLHQDRDFSHFETHLELQVLR